MKADSKIDSKTNEKVLSLAIPDGQKAALNALRWTQKNPSGQATLTTHRYQNGQTLHPKASMFSLYDLFPYYSLLPHPTAFELAPPLIPPPSVTSNRID